MTTHPVKLGLHMFGMGTVAEMVEDARRAEAAGFDAVFLPDHLGFAAPLVPLVAIGVAAPSLQLGNLALNGAFYRPALLARDLASVDSATGGRLIIGLGTGYVEQEFQAAGLAYPSPGERVRLLAEHISEIRRLLSDPGHTPPPVQTPPPIMVAGVGNKVLSLAAEHADIIDIAPQGTESDLAERVDYVKAQAGARIADIALSFGFLVAIDNPDDVLMLQITDPDATPAQLREKATVLTGSADAAAERIQRFQAEYGFTRFNLTKTPNTRWDTLEKLIAAVR